MYNVYFAVVFFYIHYFGVLKSNWKTIKKESRIYGTIAIYKGKETVN